MKQSKAPKVFVFGNGKGGVGKTTLAVHAVAGLLQAGYKVATIDTDVGQGSFSAYIENRGRYNENNQEKPVRMPLHFCITQGQHESLSANVQAELDLFNDALSQAKSYGDIIVIDTPGSYTPLSSLAHSFADMVITPVNDSFMDVDVIAKIDEEKAGMQKPSIYSEMFWGQRLQRMEREQRPIDWVVVTNRLSALNACNKRKIHDTLSNISKRMGFKLVPGFAERVIYRELFLAGLTLFDLKEVNFKKGLSISEVAARQEWRDFFHRVGLG